VKDFEGIIFDMDGVIFDSERAIMECFLEIGKKYNIKDLDKVYLLCTGVTFEKTKEIILNHYGNDFPYDKYNEEGTKLFFEKYKDYKLPLKNGVFELMKYLKANNKKIALASSTKKDLVLKELGAHNLLKYFDVIVTGDMVSKSKPEPDIYLKAIELLKIDSFKLFAIEDSFNGVKSATKANLKTIMVPDLVKPDEFIKNKATIVLSNLLEIIDYLNK
jgi:HAD superfamily hydrolase (TIGR01509 family)